MTPNARCYFGCSDRLNRTLLDLPGYSSPRLCEYHSEQWAIYRACLIVQSNTIEWPDDFWPFERKMREEMEKDSTEVGARDVRPPGTEIQASDAIVGSWYKIPSGEVERCHAIRNRGRGVQVGFVGILDTGSDPEEIRWLQGKTPVSVAKRSIEGEDVEADALATAGYLEEAKVLLEVSQPIANLEGLAAREAGKLALSPIQVASIEKMIEDVKDMPEASLWYPRPVPVYHKSLHIDWRTPQPLFDSQVLRWGPFWLDAAATAENKLCEYHLGPGAIPEDALSVDWLPTPEIVAAYGKNVWLNHPYSKSEKKCVEGCSKPKCAERGYHLERDIASSGEWLIYARDQVLLKGAPRVVCLTKAAVETGWWRDAVRIQSKEAGMFLGGECDPMGGPAAKFMDSEYPAATWFEFRWENLIVDVVEIEGRVDFDRGGNDGSAGFPSAIVTFHKPGE